VVGHLDLLVEGVIANGSVGPGPEKLSQMLVSAGYDDPRRQVRMPRVAGA
jgi:hypothetical protein